MVITSNLDGLCILGEKKNRLMHTSDRLWPFLSTTLWHLWLLFGCVCHWVFLHHCHKTSFSSYLAYWYHPTTDKTQSSVIWAGDGIICNTQKSLLMFKTGVILNTLLSLTGIFITPMPRRWRIWEGNFVFPNWVYAIKFVCVCVCVFLSL